MMAHLAQEQIPTKLCLVGVMHKQKICNGCTVLQEHKITVSGRYTKTGEDIVLEQRPKII